MISDNIKQFLQDLDAKVPASFDSDIDDALVMIVDCSLLNTSDQVTQPAPKNIEYSRKSPRDLQSISDSQPLEKLEPSEFPIHNREVDIYEC